VLGALGKDPDRAGQRRPWAAGAPVVMGDRLDAVADRGGVEPTLAHRRHFRGQGAQRDLVAAAAQLLQDWDQGEQVPTPGVV
jgi:hypothetical protein